MASINHKKAPIEIRERFAFDQGEREGVYKFLKSVRGVQGAFLLSTCNRTELYLSSKKGTVDASSILCQTRGIEVQEHEPFFERHQGDEVVRYLCLLACGAQSLLWGEDQILGQLKEAQAFARKQSALDNVLEVSLRTSVECGKKIRSARLLNATGELKNNVASQTLKRIRSVPEAKKVLVIGNGVIGRLVAREALAAGYETFMTRRSHRGEEFLLEKESVAVSYDDRYSVMRECDVVVSATSSPHLTVTKKEWFQQGGGGVLPKLFVDLAVPRDIDPEIETLKGVLVLNIDGLCADEIKVDRENQRTQIMRVIEKSIDDFNRWNDYRLKSLCF